MPITSLSQNELRESLSKQKRRVTEGSSVRILFAPTHINPEKPSDMTAVYKNVCDTHFDTLVVVESYTGELEKKLSIPSNHSFETPYGEVLVNDKYRNELCDEEDDFFISDGGLSDKMSLYTQLMMYQTCQKDFDVVNIQIGDYDTAIVKELAYALDELFLNRNALLVFCCDIPSSNTDELENLKALIERNNESALHNYINSNQKHVNGARALMTGVLVARSWGLEIHFLDDNKDADFIGGYAQNPVLHLA